MTTKTNRPRLQTKLLAAFGRIAITVILLSPCSLGAQEITPGITTGSGLSPAASANASSMEASSVDLFHGQLALQLPLYTLQGRHLILPISLAYSQPMEEEAKSFHPGWTGLGWTLQAGGVITRKLRGKPDETLCPPQSANFWPLAVQDIDHKEDVFNFNFSGYSGSFFFHQGKLILQSDNHIVQLIPIWDGASLAGFNFLLPDGTRYTFGYTPGNNGYPTDTQMASRERSSRFTGKTGLPTEHFYSAWYLTRIESPEGDVIEFLYESVTEQCVLSDRINTSSIEARFQTYSGMVSGTFVAPGNVMEEASGTIIYPSYLKRIVSSGPVDVEFSRSVATEKPYPAHYYSSNSPSGVENHFLQSDIDRITAARWYKLDAIRLLDKSKANRCFKEYRLGYLQSGASVLKLTSLNERAYPESGGSLDKPAYRFEYASYATGQNTIVEALNRLSYPTGGYALYQYERHEYEENEYGATGNQAKGLRIKAVRSFPSEGETPWETLYHYLMPEYQGGAPGTEGSGHINRLEMLSRSRVLDAAVMKGSVQWTKTSNYDQYASRLEVPSAGKVGYSSVYVQKKRGEEYGVWTYYRFSNYLDFDGTNQTYMDNNGQRRQYFPVGKMLSMIASGSAVSYEYELWDCDTVDYIDPEYCSFNYGGTPGVAYPMPGTYTKRDTAHISYYNPKYKLKKKIEHQLGSVFDTLLITSYTYNYETGNIIRTDVENPREGTVYSTRYNYLFNNPADMFRIAAGQIALPYEVITEKDGKVLGASLTEYASQLSYGERDIRFFKPMNTYLFVSETDIPVGQYAPTVTDGLTIFSKDSRYQLTASYGYDEKGLLMREEIPGALPTVNQRDAYGRITSATTGAFANRFTYNVHGVTSATSPNGSRVSTEYNAFGEPALKMDTDGNILEKYDYIYSIQP